MPELPPVAIEPGKRGEPPKFRVFGIPGNGLINSNIQTGASLGLLTSVLMTTQGGWKALLTNIGLEKVLGSGLWMTMAQGVVGLLPMIAGMAGGVLASRMEVGKYQKKGRLITPPSYFNREAFQSGVHGMMYASMIPMAVAALGSLSSLFGAVKIAGSLGSIFTLGTPAALGTVASLLSGAIVPFLIAGAAYGIYKGATAGYARMQQEYEGVRHVYLMQQEGRTYQPSLGRDPTKPITRAVTPGQVVGAGLNAVVTTNAEAPEFTRYAYDGPPEAHPSYGVAQVNPNRWRNAFNREKAQPQQVVANASEQEVPAAPARPYRNLVDEDRVASALEQLQNQR